jgi:hypothetical protein
MTSEQEDLKRFITALLESSWRQITLATADLTDEQLYYQPMAEANSMAWLVWHLSRWRDFVSAAISGTPQVWVSEGWATRCGLPHERTGLGDTLEQVRAFRVERAVLFGYMDAAHHATITRVSVLTPEQFAQPITYVPGDSRPVWRALAAVCGDSLQHTGQIAYLRGMVTGYGWRRQAGLH